MDLINTSFTSRTSYVPDVPDSEWFLSREPELISSGEINIDSVIYCINTKRQSLRLTAALDYWYAMGRYDLVLSLGFIVLEQLESHRKRKSDDVSMTQREIMATCAHAILRLKDEIWKDKAIHLIESLSLSFPDHVFLASKLSLWLYQITRHEEYAWKSISFIESYLDSRGNNEPKGWKHMGQVFLEMSSKDFPSHLAWLAMACMDRVAHRFPQSPHVTEWTKKRDQVQRIPFMEWWKRTRVHLEPLALPTIDPNDSTFEIDWVHQNLAANREKEEVEKSVLAL